MIQSSDVSTTERSRASWLTVLVNEFERLRVLNPEPEDDPDAVDEMLREVRSLADDLEKGIIGREELLRDCLDVLTRPPNERVTTRSVIAALTAALEGTPYAVKPTVSPDPDLPF